MRYSYLTVLAIVLILTTILQSSFLIIQMSELKEMDISGSATTDTTGELRLCMNQPPTVTNFTCPNSTRENVNVSCKLEASDPDGHNISYYVAAKDEANITLEIDSEGNILFRTYSGVTGNYSHLLGERWIEFELRDNSDCTNYNYYMYHFEVFDFNDPPYLKKDLPKRIIPKDETVALFRLNDYFVDPEGKELRYEVSESEALITILGSSDVLAYSNTCSDDYVIFTAYDHENLSAESNSVEIKVDCTEATSGDGSTSSGSSGTSGTGGIYSDYQCISDWQCDPWSDCTENGTRKRRCVDNNACDPDNYVHWVYDECNYVPPPECEEFWECGEWSLCSPEGLRTRECTDLNECGTEEIKPQETESCDYNPTCSDGVQNQGETGVDCGGPCLPCKELEVPGAFQDDRTIISTLMLIGMFLAISLLLVYKYFHKEINTAMAKLFLSLTKKMEKRILLSSRKKKELLARLLEVEEDISSENLKEKAMDVSEISRDYFVSIFQIPITFNKAMLRAYNDRLKLNKVLESVFLSFFDKINIVETGKRKVYKTDIFVMVEELRELIHLTSEFERADIGREIEEIELRTKDSSYIKINKHIYNTYVAMHFDRVSVAKDKYSEILNIYEDLSEEEKGKIYDDISRLFNEIKYLIAVT